MVVSSIRQRCPREQEGVPSFLPKVSAQFVTDMLAALKHLAAITTYLFVGGAAAFTVELTPGPRVMFLQVGTGTMAGLPYAVGGTPQDNATIDRVFANVPAAMLGVGALPMSSTSAVSNSPYDTFPFCSVAPMEPAQVYLGGFVRRPGVNPQSARLLVSTTGRLTNASGDTIPFGEISWTSSGANDVPLFPPGSFTGGILGLLTTSTNTWFETCLSFTYANTEVVPPGTYTGRAIYTLTSP
jgi:hypothetical protein